VPSTVYIEPSVSLETRMMAAFDELGIREEKRVIMLAYLAPLRDKSPVTHEHYEHSIRVALVARAIARFMHLEEKALFYAGMLHDIGKVMVREETLGKTNGWSEADALEMEAHVMDSWRMLRDRFDFTAAVIVRHHRFQRRGYPEVLPPNLHQFSRGTEIEIDFYARLLALADVYDAMHRINDATGGKALTGEEIKQRMFDTNPDQRYLIGQLYEAGILTTTIYSFVPIAKRETVLATTSP